MELLSLTGGIIPVIRNASSHFLTLVATVLPVFLLLRILLSVTLRLAGTARAEGLGVY